MKFFAVAAIAATAVSALDTTKCCVACPADEIKTYSIDPNAGHCGESCIHADKFWLYHIFEKWLTKTGSNSGTPCADHGYVDYWMTETHGFPHLLTVQVDFYNKTAPATPVVQAVAPKAIILLN